MAPTEQAPIKVLVAELKNDRDQAYTQRVTDTLKTARALDVEVIAAPFEPPGDNPTGAKLAQFHADVRAFLETADADLLVHGGATRAGLRLRIVGAVPPAEGRPDAVGVGDAFLMPLNFRAELANLFYAGVLAAALPGKPEQRRELAPHLGGAAERALKLLEKLPDGTDSSQVGAIYTWLGVAAACLWRLQEKPAGLTAAVAAFEKANREGPKEVTPVVMAELKIRLGLALQELAAMKDDQDMYEDAVDAFEAVTRTLDPNAYPRETGLACLGLGSTFLSRGRKQLVIGDCWRAVTAFDAALQVFTKEKDRRRWHEAKNMKGAALLTAGSIDLGAKDLEGAVEVLKAVADDTDRRTNPLQWAQASNALGSAVFALAKRTSDRARLNEAIGHFDAALAIYEERRQTVAIGVVGKNLQRAHRLRDTLGS
jgi:tetratricopeptide (TPR) repeat protein